ncbi:helix-turn-helix transcriptional regulator [Nonomuraea sp. MCN248]|uniref:Helix-turn-helix transcriptional regulator n=1 Tax=Nonomuraea corallina TaxID=2989783 RepID=A0ABT4SBK8_9ACTN|nr:helix-turn-helix transcriptional regulator [Nonomuraea corallina]MDA0634588.1 helix-turn-helix transcriptional regulator [Nonomuraea corallina]
MSEQGLVLSGSAPGRPALRPYARRLAVYREDHGGPLARVQPAATDAVLILGFAAPMEVGGRRLTSFGAGTSDRFTRTRMTAPTEGVQIDLTPFGARRLFGMPLRELANLAVPAEDLLGRWAVEAAERLAAAPSWPERLALAERLLAGRLAAGPEPDPEVRWAWARLLESGGTVPVASLAGSLRRSHRHLVSRFHDQVGLTPKAAARVIRFHRAAGLLRSGTAIAEVAATCGYYDQAHMNRDFRALGAITPGQISPRPPAARRPTLAS